MRTRPSPSSIASLWLPPLALMAVIFFLSGQPDLSSGLGVLDLVGRKLVHVGEYALLCALWWRALRTVVGPRATLTAALLVSVAYAVTDELHQTFVPGRQGSALDVVIDALGAVLAAVLIRRRHARSTEAGAPPGRPSPAEEGPAGSTGARA